MGAEVTIVSGATCFDAPHCNKNQRHQRPADAGMRLLSLVSGQDVFIGVAAVADYTSCLRQIHKRSKKTTQN